MYILNTYITLIAVAGNGNEMMTISNSKIKSNGIELGEIKNAVEGTMLWENPKEMKFEKIII